MSMGPMQRGGDHHQQQQHHQRVLLANGGSHNPDNARHMGNYVSTTKYNVVTFLPKALYEQFRRIANVYFTIVAALSCTEYSPVHPITTFSPLILVLGISIAKEALEDYKRLKADRDVNNRVADVFDQEKVKFLPKRWKDICVGDVVLVEKDNHFPADLLFLSVENPDGVCFVETVNLDGESNLKIKNSVAGHELFSGMEIAKFQARIECELPNASLYTFLGNMEHGGGMEPLSPTSMLLRGCSLRNTSRVLGVVVYAGHESKVMMNASDPPSKRTRIERSIDKMIVFMFVLLFAMCSWGALHFALWTRTESLKVWYIAPRSPSDEFDPQKPFLVAISSFVTSFIIYGYFIPISLYVSIETVKVIQAMVFIAKDKSMYYKDSDSPAVARTSNLNEELGMVQTILSDKTGTLTCNCMEFFKCSVGGVAYGEGVTEIEKAKASRMGYILETIAEGTSSNHKESFFNFYDSRLLDGKWQWESDPETIRQFFLLLAICHTVIPGGEREPDKITYEAESPDELALVVAAKKFGFFFHQRNSTSVRVKQTMGGKEEDCIYEILNILEFTSTRKRMSVVCRTPDGKIILYCKGADTVIYERLDPDCASNKEIKEATRRHMEEFGGAGLRTLCLSYTYIDCEEYDKWQPLYFAAKTALSDREERVSQVAEMLEKNLKLLGCTAIEDKLQDGVPECIEKLSEAGIKMWILTGDKQETAVNIGFACNLLNTDMAQNFVDANTHEIRSLEAQGKRDEAERVAFQEVKEQLENILKRMNSKDADSCSSQALIIDGKGLALALRKPLRSIFLEVGGFCRSVICCRVSPKQKAQVTALVRKKGFVTLAIGDGANDVGMIQEADIGVGISGQEGMQAVLSSDFAIGQFKFLLPLLLVHGRWCYKRITRMVLFFLYKNIYFGLTIFMYNSLCLFSGQLIYDDFYMSLYNVIFTSLAPLAVGLLDQDVDRVASLQFPGLYKQCQRNSCFNLWVQAAWVLLGCCHAVATMAIVFMSTSVTSDRKSGQTYGHWQIGVLLFSCVVVTVHVQLTTVIDSWTLFHQLSIWGSIIVWFMYLIVYGALPVVWAKHMHHLFLHVCGSSICFWLIIFSTTTVCVLPSFMLRSACHVIVPQDHRIVQEVRHREIKEGPKRIKERKLNRTISLEELSAFNQYGRWCSKNRGYVPDDAPGSVSFFTPQSTLDQMEYETRGLSRNPVVAKLEKELSMNPYRHRTSTQTEGALMDGNRVREREEEQQDGDSGNIPEQRFESLHLESFHTADEF